jgi:SAM-dependent methyltransferase
VQDRKFFEAKLREYICFRKIVMDNTKEWFASWFDSPFYRELYAHRSGEEAKTFILRLIEKLNLPERASVLDVCCGNGRHSAVFSENSYNVVGIDISEKSLEEAKSRNLENTKFHNADARNFELHERFDCVVNLFTSFGYFATTEEHIEMLQRIYEHLKDNGVFVFDFFNAEKVRAAGTEDRKVLKEGAEFHITKEIANNRVIKHIRIQKESARMDFQESVALFTKEQLVEMFEVIGFKNINTYGDYELGSFDLMNSDRCIIICSK